ncbi:hypothetical protein D3C80_1695970 [compost metagenome]
MRQHRLVGLEDFVVLVGAAIHAQGNRAEGVAFFHHHKTRGSDHRSCHSDLIIHAANPGNVAQCQQDLFFLFLTRDFTGHGDFVAIHRRLYIRITQANLVDVFLQLLTGIGIARRK